MRHNQDWSEVDFEAMPADFIPATAYLPEREEQPTYDVDYTMWIIDGHPVQTKDNWRIAWRTKAAIAGFGTSCPALIPSGPHHLFTPTSLTENRLNALVLIGGFRSSILIEFFVRSQEKTCCSFHRGNIPIYRQI